MALIYQSSPQPQKPVETFNETGWISTLNILAVPQTLEITTSALEQNTDVFYAKSLVTPQAQPATLASLNALAKYLFEAGASSKLVSTCIPTFYTQVKIITLKSPQDWFVQLQLYGGKGSFINSVPKEASAYMHRSSLWTIQVSQDLDQVVMLALNLVIEGFCGRKSQAACRRGLGRCHWDDAIRGDYNRSAVAE